MDPDAPKLTFTPVKQWNGGTVERWNGGTRGSRLAVSPVLLVGSQRYTMCMCRGWHDQRIAFLVFCVQHHDEGYINDDLVSRHMVEK